jgi:hypothetical protein
MERALPFNWWTTNPRAGEKEMFRERIVEWEHLFGIFNSLAREIAPIFLARNSRPAFYVRFKETNVRPGELYLRVEPSMISARSAQFNR